MLPAMAMGIGAVFGLAWLLGRREKERLGRLSLSAAATDVVPIDDSALVPAESNEDVLRRPKLFMIAFAFALLIHYPKVADQRERVAAHAKNVIAVVSLIGQPVHLLSPLVPSTYLLVGLAGVEFGDHQRFTLKWAVLVCVVMLIASLACAIFPLAA